jgi:hypothetical protein
VTILWDRAGKGDIFPRIAEGWRLTPFFTGGERTRAFHLALPIIMFFYK